jgi:hypothetical protein
METGPVSGIAVTVSSATDRGRLYPRYDDKTGILAIESRFDRPWPFGVDIDGRVVFDMDEHRVLANVDLHVPKPRWKKDLGGEMTTIAPPADLIFSHEAITTKSFSLPLTVRTDPSFRQVRIEFGTELSVRAIALSRSCIALLSADELVGFVIKNAV